MGPIGAVLAFFIDSLIGDPRSSLHPVVIMGKFIGLLERLFRKKKDSPKIQIVKGALLVLLVLAISWSVTYGLLIECSLILLLVAMVSIRLLIP